MEKKKIEKGEGVINQLLICRNINRIPGGSIHRNYNLMEHQWVVGMLFKYFANLEGISYCINVWDTILNHDIAESATLCDLSYQIKNLNETTKRAWEEIEEQALSHHPYLEKYSDLAIKKGLNEKQYALFKSMDYLDLWIFCKEEIALGNKTKRVIGIEFNCLELISEICNKYGFNSVLKFIDEYEV